MTTKTSKLIAAGPVSVAVYVLSIMAANVTTSQLGLVTIFGLTVAAGTAFAGFALVARDLVQNNYRNGIVVACILIGAALSAVTSSVSLAVASGIAFLFSELVDLAVYSPLRRYSVPIAVIASSIVAAPVDTVLFLHLAGFPVTWQTVSGQFIVKTLVAIAAALVLTCRSISRAR